MQGTKAARKPVISSKTLAAGLAVATAVVLSLCGPVLARRTQYWYSGVVTAEGLRFHLDPNDAVITGAILRDGTWEKAETETIRRLLAPGDTFIDVGANVGWYTAIASRSVGPRGRVIAFEPAPGSLAYLRRTVAENGCRNVTIEPKALSDKPGTLDLHIGVENKGHNSIIASGATGETVAVEAVTLDDYLGDVPGGIRLIKIDTEGAEGFILRGMRETFRKNPHMAILMEYHPRLIRSLGFDPPSLIRDLYGLGYKFAAIEANSGREIPVVDEDLDRLTAALEKETSFVNLLGTR
jgi:FkbM family methyltransferase